MTVMYIDIETIPATAFVGMDPTTPPGWVCPEFTATPKPPAKNLRDAAKIEAAQQKNFAAWMEAKAGHEVKEAAAAMADYRKNSLTPLKGRIACIGYAVDDAPSQVIQCDDDERDGLDVLMGVIRNRGISTIIAHNGHGFDYGFIWKRLLLHDHCEAGRFYQAKPWETKLQDTLTVWRGTDRRAKGSMDAICEFFGWSRDDNPIRGSEVFDRYIAGDMAAIVQHCREDVNDLRKLAEKLEMGD